MLELCQAEALKPADARDCETPRGVSKTNEIIRLRSLLAEQRTVQLMILADKKFLELADSNGVLQNEKLDVVADYILECSGDVRLKDDSASLKAKVMKRVDVNRDGKLDKAEFSRMFEEELRHMTILRAAKQKFEEIDKDKSGFLTGDELQQVIRWVVMMQRIEPEQVAAVQLRLMERVMAFDDGDNRLSLEEFSLVFEEEIKTLEYAQLARAKFVELDRDKSGFLDGGEWRKVVDWLMKLEKAPEAERKQFMHVLVAKIDKNNDGVLSIEEFISLFEWEMHNLEIMARGRRKFLELDADLSGTLTEKELIQVCLDL